MFRNKNSSTDKNNISLTDKNEISKSFKIPLIVKKSLGRKEHEQNILLSDAIE